MATVVVPATASHAATPDIVGGTPVANGTYPFQAALLDLQIGGSDYDDQICGGTLVAPNVVMTAAHCVTFGGKVAAPSTFAVTVGRTVLSSDQGQRFKVKAVFRHPRYDPHTLANDVALVELDGSSSYTPIALGTGADKRFEVAGTLLTVIGWGDTNAQPGNPHHYPDRMRQVQVPVVSDRTCAKVYKPSGWIIPIGKTLCAGAEGIDSCFGDSGGPLFAVAKGEPVELGIVSAGHGCAKYGFPGTYTEVDAPSVSTWVHLTIASVS
jgi:secreted trypsin-like serine protease